MRRPASRAGITMVDTVMALTLLSVSVLTLLPLFNVTGRRHTALDAGAALSAKAQEAAGAVQNAMTAGRRVYLDGPAAATLLQRLAPALPAAPVPWTRLPREDAGAAASSATFVAANAGDSLLMAVAGPVLNLADLVDGHGRSAQLRLETTVISYHYLAPAAGRKIGDLPALDLWEWRSDPLVDNGALVSLADATLRNAAIAALVAAGRLYAFDRSTASAASFYRLSADLPWISPLPPSEPLGGTARNMVDLAGRKELGYFLPSVSPNTGGAFVHRHAVPSHALPEGDFPGGFEVLAAGPPEGRRVMARLVVAAQGSFKGTYASEHTATATVKER